MDEKQEDDFVKTRIAVIRDAIKEDANKLFTNIYTHDMPKHVIERIEAAFSKEIAALRAKMSKKVADDEAAKKVVVDATAGPTAVPIEDRVVTEQTVVVDPSTLDKGVPEPAPAEKEPKA